MIVSTAQRVNWRGLGRVRRARLGQVTAADVGVYGGWDPSITSSPAPASAEIGDTSGCWWDYITGIFSPTQTALEAYQQCLNEAGVAQIQSVPANAQTYYGPNSVAAQTAQQVAAQQIAQVPLDTQTITSDYNLPSNPFYPSIGPGVTSDPSTWPTWLWVAIFGAGTLLVVGALK